MPTSILYESDFHAWAAQTASALRAGRLEEIDTAHLIEELEEMSASTRRELVNRLTVLLAHLLKWQFQPDKQSRSWQATIRVQRRTLVQLLADNPSLRARLGSFIDKAYKNAIDLAWGETGLDYDAFPDNCPYTSDQILDETFFPI